MLHRRRHARTTARALLALITLCAIGPSTRAQVTPLVAPPASTITDHAAILASGERTPQERVNAAATLLREGRLEPLLEALRPESPPELGAIVASALSTRPSLRAGELLLDPPEQLLEPLVRALKRAPAESKPVLASAIGAYRSRAAARALIEELSGAPPDAVRIGVCDALVRLSGRDDLAADPARWRAWWTQAERLTEGDWRTQIARGQAERAGRLAAQGADTIRQLVAARGQLYAASPPESRPARLIELLSADRVELRLLGFELAERELLNARTLTDAVTEAAFLRLADPEPAVRIAATRLIGNVSTPDSARLITALQRETDPAVLAAMIGVTARRPTAELAATFVRWLSEPAPVGDAAAEALASCADASCLAAPVLREKSLEFLRSRPPASLSSAQGRLLAVIGGWTDRAQLLDALVEHEPVTRAAIAEALGGWLDASEALIAGARHDPALFAGAARALINFRTNAGAHEALESFAPPSPERLSAARTRLLEVMPPEQVLAIAARATTPSVRAALLTRVGDQAASGLVQPPSLAARILCDGASARLEQDDAAGALAWLGRLSGLPAASHPKDADRLRTLALIRVNRLTDPALDLAPPTDWIGGLRLVVERQADHAPAVRDQILTRFGGRLSASEEEQIRALLPPVPPGEGAGASPPPQDPVGPTDGSARPPAA